MSNIKTNHRFYEDEIYFKAFTLTDSYSVNTKLSEKIYPNKIVYNKKNMDILD